MVAPCYWGMQLRVARHRVMVAVRWQRIAACYWGIQLHVARRRGMVGARWQWLADRDALFLGDAIANW